MTDTQESNLLTHARRELAALRGPNPEPDEMQDEMDKCVLDVVRIFADQGHSGSSAAYAIGCIEKVLRFEPITPLAGTDDEWVEVAEEDGKPLFQNARCGRVFKVGADGEAYDLDGFVFRDPDGSTWTNSESRRPVTFPYTPTTEVVDRADPDA
jgi:hypothetical protein